MCKSMIRGNFRQEKNFANFAICSRWRNFYHMNFLSRVNDYREDMAIFTATKLAGLGEIFVKQKFSHIQSVSHYRALHLVTCLRLEA